MKKRIFIIALLCLAAQIKLWPLPLYYWIAGECTSGLLRLEGQNLLKICSRGSWQSPQIKKWHLISSREVFALKKPWPDDEFLMVAFTPWELNNLSYSERVEYIKKATERAVAMGADLVCDASAADRARQTEKDRATTRLLKKAGVARAVIFDGGHHLPNLALEPELLLCPIIEGPQRELLVAHGFCRDAVPLEVLLGLKKQLGLNSTIITFPRFTGYLKCPSAMGALLGQALELLEQTQPQKPQDAIETLAWGPRYSFFANGLLLWRPDQAELSDIEGACKKLELEFEEAIEQAFVALDGEGQLPENEFWNLATVGLCSWQIVLAKLAH